MFTFLRHCLAGVMFLVFICQSALGQISFLVEKHVLDNGLTVLISEDHSAPVVTYQVWYKVGSKNERPGITGISHLCEHIMLKDSQEHWIPRARPFGPGADDSSGDFAPACLWNPRNTSMHP